jgi:hypothetical protein
MELYNVNDGNTIIVRDNIKIPVGAIEIHKDEILRFHRIDGKYGICTNNKRERVYLVAWAEVEIV